VCWCSRIKVCGFVGGVVCVAGRLEGRLVGGVVCVAGRLGGGRFRRDSRVGKKTVINLVAAVHHEYNRGHAESKATQIVEKQEKEGEETPEGGILRSGWFAKFTTRHAHVTLTIQPALRAPHGGRVGSVIFTTTSHRGPLLGPHQDRPPKGCPEQDRAH